MIVYSPSGTTVPPLALPSHVTAAAPPVEATVNVRTVVLPASATRTAIEPASVGVAVVVIVSATPSPFGLNWLTTLPSGAIDVIEGAVVSTTRLPVPVAVPFCQASPPRDRPGVRAVGDRGGRPSCRPR